MRRLVAAWLLGLGYRLLESRQGYWLLGPRLHVIVTCYQPGLHCSRCGWDWDGTWERDDRRLCAACVDALLGGGEPWQQC